MSIVFWGEKYPQITNSSLVLQLLLMLRPVTNCYKVTVVTNVSVVTEKLCLK